MVYRTAYKVTRNRQDAEDSLENVFTKLAERGCIPDVADLKGYLYTAAVHEALKIIQSTGRQNHGDYDVELLADPITVREANDHDILHALRDAIAKLEPSDVELLSLFYDHGYTDAQIATILGKSRISVAVALNRVRARLQKLMCDEGESKQ